MIANHPSRCFLQEAQVFFQSQESSKKITRDAWCRGLFKNLKKIRLTLKPNCRPWNVLETQIQGKTAKAFYKNWHLWANRWMCVTNYLTFWGSSNLLHFFPLNIQLYFIFPSFCNKETLFNQPLRENFLPVSLLLSPMQRLYPFCCYFLKGHYKQLFKQQM